MRNQLRRDLTAALKARDPVTISALRSALSAIENAEAIDINTSPSSGVSYGPIAGSSPGLGAGEVERRPLTDTDMQSIIKAQADQQSSAARQYQRLGHSQHADRLLAEAAVLRRYLPQSL